MNPLGKRENVTIHISQYNNNNIYTHRYNVLGQFIESNIVWLLDVMQYDNGRVSKMNMHIPYRN